MGSEILRAITYGKITSHGVWDENDSVAKIYHLASVKLFDSGYCSHALGMISVALLFMISGNKTVCDLQGTVTR